MKKFAALATALTLAFTLTACFEIEEDDDASPALVSPTGADTSGGMPPVLRTDGKPTVGIGSGGPGSLYVDPINGGIGIDLGGGIGMPIG